MTPTRSRRQPAKVAGDSQRDRPASVTSTPLHTRRSWRGAGPSLRVFCTAPSPWRCQRCLVRHGRLPATAAGTPPQVVALTVSHTRTHTQIHTRTSRRVNRIEGMRRSMRGVRTLGTLAIVFHCFGQLHHLAELRLHGFLDQRPA